MCLIANTPLTDTVKKLTGKLTVWKAFLVNHKYKDFFNKEGVRLRTRWVGATLKARYRAFDYQPDVEYLARDSKIDLFNDVYHGLHVCLTEEEANGLITINSPYQVVIKLEVDIADLVAIGRFSDYPKGTHEDLQAVFTALTIPKKTYDKAIATAIKNLRVNCPEYFPKNRNKTTLKKNH